MRYSLLVVALGVATASYAQRGRGDGNSALEGRYATSQSGNRIKRLLILERDGRCEIDTTDTRNDRRDMSRNDVERYGTTAQKARATGRRVRHVGRWETDGKGIKLRMQDVIGDLQGSEKFDVTLDYRNGALVFGKDTDAYGNERMEFRREGSGFDDGRYQDRNDLAGRYGMTSSRSGVKRVLILESDGRCEIVTTDDAYDRRAISRDDVRRYGTTAEKARSTRRPIRHIGRWVADGSGIRLRLQDVIGDLKGSEKFDVTLDYRNGAFVFDKDTEAYGTERMEFRREGSRLRTPR